LSYANPNDLDKFVGDYGFNPKAGATSIPIGQPVEVLEIGTRFMSYKGKSVLAIIPARGGSEGIPLKNLAKIGDKTLVRLAIESAGQCPLVNWIAVSTDHPQIKFEAHPLQNNWHTNNTFIIDRPPELSTGKVGDVAVLTHAVRECKTDFEIILMLQPTSPFRRPEHIQAAIEKLVDRGYDSVWSVSPIRDHPYKALETSWDHKLNERLYYFGDDNEKTEQIKSRQELPPAYRRNGVVYAMTRECLLEKKALLTENTGYILLEDFQISIDTEEDLILANLYYKYREALTPVKDDKEP